MEDTNKIEEQFVEAVMNNDNLKATKKLEQLLQHKCAKKIDTVLNNQ